MNRRMYATSTLLKSFSNVHASGCFGNLTSFQFEKVLNDSEIVTASLISRIQYLRNEEICKVFAI